MSSASALQLRSGCDVFITPAGPSGPAARATVVAVAVLPNSRAAFVQVATTVGPVLVRAEHVHTHNPAQALL
jgi:lysophospholipid acyltransferase (LPLAT)-like uncharacterized protein